MTEQSEWQFIVDYLKDSTTDFYNDACQNQLVALWTSYCLHNSLDVDTAMYDAVLMDMLPPTCAINGCCLSKPPQSWCYVAEAKEDDAL